MKKNILILSFVLFLAGCFNQNTLSQNGKSVSLQFMKPTSIDVVSVKCRVTADDMDTIVTYLSVTPTMISGEISEVPYGEGRLFEIMCYNSSGDMNYYGSALTDINNIAPTVNITLYQVDSTANVTIIGTFGDEEETEEKIVFAADYSGNYDIYIMDADGTNIEQLTTSDKVEVCPNLSFDRSKIVFQRAGDTPGGSYCCVLNVETKEVDVLAFSDTFRVHYASWHPDGNKIIFWSDARDGNSDIYSYDLINDKVDTLVMNEARDWMAYYSPDGNSILYSSEDSIGFRAYIANAQGENPQMINPLISAEERRAGMNPVNPNLIVYSGRYLDGFSTGQWGIFYTDLSDHQIYTVVSTPGVDEVDPCWSPDGSMIYYGRYSGIDYGIYRINQDGSNAQKILDAEGNERYAFCR